MTGLLEARGGADTDEAPPPWWRPPATDVLLAVVMAGYSLYDVVVNQSWTGPVAVNAVVVTAMALSLAFRRRLPLVVPSRIRPAA